MLLGCGAWRLASALPWYVRPLGQVDQFEGVLRLVDVEHEKPPWLWIVLSENALRQQIGGPEVMVKQIDVLLEMGARSNVNIQVLPSYKPSIPGSISLLTGQVGERSAYAEGFITGTYCREPDDADRFQRIYDQLQAGALDIEASAQVMRDARRKHQE
ncbi:Scr1 family TA system antitoxin-like transcriptional regulator [Streptomyces sp. NPDC093097]|uniref:Scr1 family TA system antitoxin-like transcriptional regulator n=1 Tax=Streptomyces sp. NPDC093097 TaxID=3366027 RepID=UPI003814A42D